MTNTMFELKPELDTKIGAVLRYQGAPDANPTADLTADVAPGVFLTYEMLSPVNVQNAPATVAASTTFTFSVSFLVTVGGGAHEQHISYFLTRNLI